MVLPSFKPSRPGKIVSLFERRDARETAQIDVENTSENESGSIDPGSVLSTLKALVAAEDHGLEPILGSITDAARRLTGASGAALAMWKEGAMVCRARTGDAPPLGARLSADTGISGECLRTAKIQICSDTDNDPMVDAEVCRSLGLRSIVALPIQGWRGVNGILEVFSSAPTAFDQQHLDILQQLAALAERARATYPHGASAGPPKPLLNNVETVPGLLPASDRLGDVVLAFVGTGSRPLILGGIGLAAVALLAVVMWLGWRGAEEVGGKAHATATVSAKNTDFSAPAVPLATNVSAANPTTVKSPDGDPIWRADPGGEVLFSSNGKPSAGAPVKFASKMDFVTVRRTPLDHPPATRKPLLGDVPDKVSAGGTAPSSKSDADADTVTDLSTAGDLAGQSTLNEVLSAKASLPGLGFPVSQGVSGGQLVHRVPPVYPAQAITLRSEGTVVLTAMVMEDGSVKDVRVVEGSSVFAQSALDAVKHWRYKPYLLDGKPVKNAIRISVDFKFPTR